MFIGFEKLSSDDQEIVDTDKDKDYTPSILECIEDINESLEDSPLDLDIFLGGENIFRGTRGRTGYLMFNIDFTVFYLM